MTHDRIGMAVAMTAFITLPAALHAGEPGRSDQIDRTIEIAIEDNLFAIETLDVTAGETVRLVFVNEGTILHSALIASPADQVTRQEHVAMMAGHGMLSDTAVMHDMAGMDHGAMQMDLEVENGVFVAPGESAELIWTFAAGDEVEIGCSIPGHYETGMAITVNVAGQG